MVQLSDGQVVNFRVGEVSLRLAETHPPRLNQPSYIVDSVVAEAREEVVGLKHGHERLTPRES